MDRSRLVEWLDQVERELRETERERREKEQHERSLHLTRQGIRELLGFPPESPVSTSDTSDADDQPFKAPAANQAGMLLPIRPRKAILQLIEEEPRAWTLREMADTMRTRGWLDPRLRDPIDTIRAAATRLWKIDALLDRVNPNTFAPRPAAVTQQEASGD